jgi:hypothetical protein
MILSELLMIIVGCLLLITVSILLVLYLKKKDVKPTPQGSNPASVPGKETSPGGGSGPGGGTSSGGGSQAAVSEFVSKFPPGIKNSLLILNSTNDEMKAFLSPDLAFYKPDANRTKPDSYQDYVKYWSSCEAQFTIYSPNNGDWKSEPGVKNYYQTLGAGQCWVITLPTDDQGNPVTCNGYTDSGSGDKCTGITIWVENINQRAYDDKQIYRIPNTSIIEANFVPGNKQNINYDFSAVDGINFTAQMYCGLEKSSDGPDAIKKCKGVDISNCPKKDDDIDGPILNGFVNCYAPKHYKNRNKTCSFALEGDCYGCGEKDQQTDIDKFKAKCQCHKIWDPKATDTDTKAWRNYLKDCSIYTWAYDEQFLKDMNNIKCDTLSDVNANIYDTNPVSLQLVQNKPDINLYIDILSVFDRKK